MSKKRKKLSRDQKRKGKLAKRNDKKKKLVQRQERAAWIERQASLAANVLIRQFNAMWSPEKIDVMGTEAIIAKLRTLGIEFDQQEFLAAAPNVYQPMELADHLWPEQSEKIEGVDADFPWMAAEILWKRLCPEILHTDAIIGGIDEGDAHMQRNDNRAACDSWLQTWELLKNRFLDGADSIEIVEKRVGDYYSVTSWLADVESELAMLAPEDPVYLQKRLTFCQEYCALLPASPYRNLKQMFLGIADSYFLLGNAEAGEAALDELERKFPDSRWDIECIRGTLWSDPDWESIPADPHKAMEHYRNAAQLAPPDEVDSIQDRIDELAEDMATQ